MKIPDDFRPVSLDTLLKTFPTLWDSLWAHLHTHDPYSQDPLATTERVRALEAGNLIQFAIRKNGEPGLFCADPSKFALEGASAADQAFADHLVQFWDRTGRFSTQGGTATITSVHKNFGVTRVVTPQGDQIIQSTVVQQLLDRGLLIKDNHGVVHAESKTELIKLTAEYGVCDFCSAPDTSHALVVPDFTMSDIGGASVGGWACCATCFPLVQANDRPALLKRSQQTLGGDKYTAMALADLHRRFWEVWDDQQTAAGIGTFMKDFVEDTLPNAQDLEFTPHMRERQQRIAAIQRLTGLTGDETDALLRGDLAYRSVAKKLVLWRKRYGQQDAKAMARLLERPVLPPGHIPHWQVALNQKYAAMQWLQKAVTHADGLVQHFPQSIDLNDPAKLLKLTQRAQHLQEFQKMAYDEDVTHLRQAATYSFNGETMAAIRQGAESIPHESTLASVTLPRQAAGFFWFAEPFPVTSSSIVSDRTAALLWGWQEGGQLPEPSLRLTAFVQEPDGRLLPSTKWIWPVSKSFHDMLALNGAAHQRLYGPGGKYEGMPNLVGLDDTMRCIAELSLFFLMSCVWMKQRVVVSSPGHIERHARKRLQREHKLTTPPEVQVIALRASERGPKKDGEATEGRKFDSWRWVVEGHPRLQACGPGRTDHKLIWISPYIKGPEDKPLKPKTQRVFAVVR